MNRRYAVQQLPHTLTPRKSHAELFGNRNDVHGSNREHIHSATFPTCCLVGYFYEAPLFLWTEETLKSLVTWIPWSGIDFVVSAEL